MQSNSKLYECDRASKLVLSGMIGVEQSLPMEDLMKHREARARFTEMLILYWNSNLLTSIVKMILTSSLKR